MFPRKPFRQVIRLSYRIHRAIHLLDTAQPDTVAECRILLAAVRGILTGEESAPWIPYESNGPE